MLTKPYLGISGLMTGLLAVIMLLARVKKPGARQDWASIPNLTSLRQTAWSSLRQSQPGMFSRKAWVIVYRHVSDV